MCEGGDELDTEVQVGEHLLDAEPGRTIFDEYTGQPLPHEAVVKARKEEVKYHKSFGSYDLFFGQGRRGTCDRLAWGGAPER